MANQIVPTMELVSALPSPRSRHLVFTSAGNHSNVRRWVDGTRDFDLWVVYYGDKPGTCSEHADYYVHRKGSKFQNLLECYRQYGAVLGQYDAIMVMDDDIIIDAASLNRLFRIREELDLWVLQPAFRLIGKISWDITRVRPTARLRYTNFVEMTCPLFRKDKLDAFMAVYDPELVGYGINWWFLDAMGKDLAGHVAVVDEITCINPHDRNKGGMREIDRLQSTARRQEVWERIRLRYGLGRWEQKESSRLNRSLIGSAAGMLEYLPDWATFHGRGLAKRLVQAVLPGSRANESA